MKNYLSLIKFSHTVFALPFALVGFMLGTYHKQEMADWRILICVLLCMVFARSAAMAFNRYLDRDIDKLNPRTAQREIPAGVIHPQAALGFVILNSILFVATTWFINPLCFALSPIALVVILGYSYTKRFTFLCHFILGLGLSLAPIGAYISVTGAFHWLPILYSIAVLLWVSGFDIIYALQDETFDKSQSLKSIPVKMGTARALCLSNVLHLICGIIIWVAAYFLSLYPVFGWLHWLGATIFTGLLFYQHLLVKPKDLSRVNLAFMTTNGVASVIFGSLVILDYFV